MAISHLSSRMKSLVTNTEQAREMRSLWTAPAQFAKCLEPTDFITDGKARWGSDDVWITQDLRLKPHRRRRGYKIEVKTGIAGSQPQRCLFV
jgi:hypothetical protein